jgi:hypothetical protein
MTTSANEHPEDDVDYPPWCRDTIGGTNVINGRPRYAIQDMSFDDAWIQSDLSYRINKMQ